MMTAAIITASDKGYAGQREDLSGPAIQQMLTGIAQIVSYKVLPDDRQMLAEEMVRLSDLGINLVFTTGGTGLSPRDVTPEATLDIAHRLVPGIAEAMRAKSLEKTPRAMLSRATCATRDKTLIINLPGSPKACRECLEVVLPNLQHAVDILTGVGGECAR